MLIGYARILIDDPNLDIQRNALELAGCENIFEDQQDRVKTERPGLQSALQFAREYDTLVVWRLDCLSYSLKNLIEMTILLESRKIGLKSLQESIDTVSSSGVLILHLFKAFAEFERNLVRERTRTSLQAARASGRKGGRPKALNKDKQLLAVRLYDERQYTVEQICKLVGISKPTLYKYITDAKMLSDSSLDSSS